MVELEGNGRALVVTLLFRLLFGGYVVGMDQYHFNDLESAWTVLVIYALIGIFTTVFLFGKKIGILGVIGLEGMFIVLNSVFLILTLDQIVEAGMHDPLANWWATLLRYLFSIMTLIFSIGAYRERKNSTFEHESGYI